MPKKLLSVLLSFVLCCSTLCIFNVKSDAASSTITNNATYYIKNKRTGKYLTAAGATAGSNIYQADFNGSSSQKFKLVYKETSTYAYYSILYAANTDLYVDVNNASDSNNANIKLFTETSYTQAQRFRLIATNTSTIKSYRIMPKLSTTRVLSVAGGSLFSGANVELYTSSSNYAYQDWIFENVSNTEVINVTPINIYAQETNSTCGAACARMIVAKYGVYLTENEIKEKAVDIVSSTSDYTAFETITPTVNYFLRINNKNIEFAYESFSLDLDAYTLLLGLAVSENMPLQVPFVSESLTSTALPYTSYGHYCVVTGLKSDSSTNKTYVCIADPYATGSTTHAGIWEIPIEEFRLFNQRHSGRIMYQVTD